MSILNIFRTISGDEVFNRVGEIVHKYHLKYELKREADENTKGFYISCFDNIDSAIVFVYMPINGKYVPLGIGFWARGHVQTSMAGIECYHNSCYHSYKWGQLYNRFFAERALEKLDRHIESCIKHYDNVVKSYEDWKFGKASNPDEIHLEAVK